MKYEVAIACEYAGGHIGKTSLMLLVNAKSAREAGKIAIASVKNAKTIYGDPMYENFTIINVEKYVEPTKEETAWLDEMFLNE